MLARKSPRYTLLVHVSVYRRVRRRFLNFLFFSIRFSFYYTLIDPLDRRVLRRKDRTDGDRSCRRRKVNVRQPLPRSHTLTHTLSLTRSHTHSHAVVHAYVHSRPYKVVCVWAGHRILPRNILNTYNV